ncbi:MAG: cob(I)yrinic acid a,c-diamide adenosyltransferase [Elusimicrobiota bacterium]
MNQKAHKDSDSGWTTLRGGARVRKCHPRLGVCGDTDELNSLLGAVLSVLPRNASTLTVRRGLATVQRELLDAGCALGGPCIGRQALSWQAAADRLTARLDALRAGSPRLSEFVIPGGSSAAAWLHVARTVCRRVERGLAALPARERIPAGMLAYMNRLSAYLFAAALRVDRR